MESIRGLLVKSVSSAVESLEMAAESADKMSIDAAVGVLLRARELDDELRALKSECGKILKRLKEETIPARFEESGITTITVDGYRYTKSESIRASMKDKEAAKDWLRNNDLGDLVTETVNSSTLSATARTLLEDGGELPEDVFNVYIMNNTSVTKVSK